MESVHSINLHNKTVKLLKVFHESLFYFSDGNPDSNIPSMEEIEKYKVF